MPEARAGGGDGADQPGVALRRKTGLTRRELDCWDDELLRRLADLEGAEDAVWRLRRVRRLRQHLGLDYEALEIILRLVDELERRPPPTTATRVRVTVLKESPGP